MGETSSALGSKTIRRSKSTFGALAPSRLVHPTSTGFRYCAWVSDIFSDDPMIQAIPFKGISPDVMLGPNARNWLTENDGLEIRRLMHFKNNVVLAIVTGPWCSNCRRRMEYCKRLLLAADGASLRGK